MECMPMRMTTFAQHLPPCASAPMQSTPQPVLKRYSRHFKRYRDFKTEYQRLQSARIAAFRECRSEVEGGVYPGPEYCVSIADGESASFLKCLPEANAFISMGDRQQ